MQNRFFTLLALLFFLFPFSSSLFSQESQKSENPHPTPLLRKHMRAIAVALSEIESYKSSDPIPWKTIQEKTKIIQNNLISIAKNNPNSATQAYVGRLTSMVGEFEILEAKKDSKLFDRIPSMTRTCYQCHQSHGVLGITEVKH